MDFIINTGRISGPSSSSSSKRQRIEPITVSSFTGLKAEDGLPKGVKERSKILRKNLLVDNLSDYGCRQLLKVLCEIE